MDQLEDAIDRIVAQTGFSGVVRVDRGDEVVLDKAYGYAHRAHHIPNRVDTQFGIASGTKGFTALTIVSLIEDGVLDRSTTARSLLDDDLPLVRDDVTVEHLLAHRSGIGDYLDEEVMQERTEYILTVPAHELATSHLGLTPILRLGTSTGDGTAGVLAVEVLRAAADCAADGVQPPEPSTPSAASAHSSADV